MCHPNDADDLGSYACLLACWDFSPDKKLSVLLKKVHKVLQGVHNVNVNYLRKKSEERIFLLILKETKKTLQKAMCIQNDNI